MAFECKKLEKFSNQCQCIYFTKYSSLFKKTEIKHPGKTKSSSPRTEEISQVRYLPQWPYICLKVRGQATINPSIEKETIVNSYLENNP